MGMDLTKAEAGSIWFTSQIPAYVAKRAAGEGYVDHADEWETEWRTEAPKWSMRLCLCRSVFVTLRSVGSGTVKPLPGYRFDRSDFDGMTAILRRLRGIGAHWEQMRFWNDAGQTFTVPCSDDAMWSDAP